MLLQKRYCPNCGVFIGNLFICNKCSNVIASESRPRWLASILSYLYGMLIGAIALIVVHAVGILFSFEPPHILLMIVFGLFAVGSWNSMKTKLYKIEDNAEIKEFETASLSSFDDPKISIGKNAICGDGMGNLLILGKVIDLNLSEKKCVIQKANGKKVTKPFEGVLVETRMI